MKRTKPPKSVVIIATDHNGRSPVWFRVRDKLPERHVTVLTYSPSSRPQIWLGHHDGSKWLNAFKLTRRHRVLYWMPLPAAPTRKLKVML